LSHSQSCHICYLSKIAISPQISWTIFTIWTL
jgi:hypothetical protein